MPKPFENAHEVFFEQSDPRWGRLPYAGYTVSWAGCGLVAYTMCVDVGVAWPSCRFSCSS